MNRPVFLDLSRDEATKLLRRNHFGRIAFAFHDRVDIEPISYTFHDGWLYGRTSAGTKLTMVLHHPWVAFEVDEIAGSFDWLSVVVHGALYILDAVGDVADRELFASALALLREADVDAFTQSDPTPHRTTIFRIHADEITGRGATTSP
jgi:nitroimidazol reductase NimA-like FMN-containing flavoprotein (pyridoxamine 5'-phosphate oxidase superfamily)